MGVRKEDNQKGKGSLKTTIDTKDLDGHLWRSQETWCVTVSLVQSCQGLSEASSVSTSHDGWEGVKTWREKVVEVWRQEWSRILGSHSPFLLESKKGRDTVTSRRVVLYGKLRPKPVSWPVYTVIVSTSSPNFSQTRKPEQENDVDLWTLVVKSQVTITPPVTSSWFYEIGCRWTVDSLRYVLVGWGSTGLLNRSSSSTDVWVLIWVDSALLVVWLGYGINTRFITDGKIRSFRTLLINTSLSID